MVIVIGMPVMMPLYGMPIITIIIIAILKMHRMPLMMVLITSAASHPSPDTPSPDRWPSPVSAPDASVPPSGGTRA